MPSANRPSATRSTSLRRAGVLLAIGGAVLVVLLCGVGLVFLYSQASFIADLVGKTNTPRATVKNSPSAIPSAVAVLETATPPGPIVPSPVGSGTPLPTVSPTSVPLALPRPTKVPTTAPPPAASRSPVAAPGVYVTGMRIEPAQVMNGQTPRFYVTFWNNQTTPITYTWFIKIFEPDKRQSFGEEAKVANAIAPGTSTLVSASNWKAPGELPCRPFLARVFYYLAQDNAVVEFSMPAGNPYLLDFQVCQ